MEMQSVRGVHFETQFIGKEDESLAIWDIPYCEYFYVKMRGDDGAITASKE